MASVGERLKAERETRNTTLEEMVVATGIGQSYLDALERGAIQELPGKAFGKLYIRAYAEVFGFDPQPWIDDYDREQRSVQGPSTEPTSSAPAGSRPVAAAIAQWKAARAAEEKAEPAGEAVVEQVAPEVAPEEVPQPGTPPAEPVARPEVIRSTAADVVFLDMHVHVPTSKRLVAPLLLLGVVAIASAIYFGMRGDRSVDPAGRVQPSVGPVPESHPLAPPPPVIAKPQTPAPRRAPVVPTASAPGSLTVPEFGVGRRVVNLHLEGESDRFAPLDRVCFSTRVLGGQRGEVVRHVWLYEGRIQQTITLRLGSPDWRTHTNKTLGLAGEWAVEARDDKGRVLARAAFTCVPVRP
jgi:transcriptional regulator with XRE-family HTH domain